MEARHAESIKRGLHREFGGKCPKDLHAECKAEITLLKEKITELENENEQLRNGKALVDFF